MSSGGAAMADPDDPLAWLDLESGGPSRSRHGFRSQLEAVDRELVAVGTMVGDLVTPVTTAFLEGDSRSAAAAARADAEVGRRCRLLEDRCLALLARQSPVATDLRRIVAVLRALADVQRSASLLRHVAGSLSWIHPPAMRPELGDMIGRMGVVAGEVFAGALRAWRAGDALAAVELQRLDDEVDLAQKTVLTELYLGGQTVEEAVSLALICRYYERIADHGVEIARHVTYSVTGQRPGEP